MEYTIGKDLHLFFINILGKEDFPRSPYQEHGALFPGIPQNL